MYTDVIMAGFGGQGIMLIGDILTYAAMHENKCVTYMPTYGVEMRGGTANCTIMISDEEIGSPMTGHPHSVIVMNGPSLVKFQPRVRPGGFMLVNTSLVDAAQVNRTDIDTLLLPANDIALELGNGKIANMVALGGYVERTQVVSLESIKKTLPKAIAERYHKTLPINIKAIETGAQLARRG
ncbi:MAG: 2-oxoacid:acceptor oxidoreductase family protein [Candidatus Lindowbacteria bacterium]|nr:2-oxoacid:acceptor oxidoreductase family protein [Candidatus Lindowbacteria bacterium]